jgi:protein-disulfide isomerase
LNGVAFATAREGNEPPMAQRSFADFTYCPTTPDFSLVQAAVDKYVDKYVDFMNKYSEADSSTKAGMISDYTKLMQQYNDYMKKLDAIDSKNLSTADLAYYEKVNAEILKKLSEVK